MKLIQTRSLHFRLAAFIILVFALLITLVAVNNVIAFREIQSKIYDSMKENLVIYQNRLNDSFDTAENYLRNYAYDDGNIRIIDKNDISSEQFFSSIYQIQKSFRSAISIYDMDGFFLYSPEGNTYIGETKSDSTYGTNKRIKDELCTIIDNSTLLTEDNKSEWFPLQINDSYYLFRILRIHNSYLGVWISIRNALAPIVGKELKQNVFFVNKDGQVISDNPPINHISLPELSEINRYQYIDIMDEKNLIVSRKWILEIFILYLSFPETSFLWVLINIFLLSLSFSFL